MISILSAIVVLGILIFVHELGHFLFAKYFGVGVETFSLGFGPKIFARKVGETEYRISAFPLGGYVKMVGENIDEELPPEDLERSFLTKKPLQRMAIVAAGPIFNLVFAYLIFIVVCMIGIPTATSKIGEVLKDKPAARAGLKEGDRVTSINGQPINRWNDLAELISASGGKPLAITAVRDGRSFSVRITPEMHTAKNLLGETITAPAIGVMASKEFVTERVGPLQAVVKGSEHTWNVTKLTVIAVGKIFTGSISADNIGGPIMIAKTAGDQAKTGLVYFLSFMALLSINLGLLNLLPVPILDGGHLVFYLWEMIIGKPVNLKTREIAQQVGLVLLVGLMVFAFYNDIARYLLGQG
ncbi:MAG: RIP metalloprotease RseP [Deltaproteobacteria bacterium]|nr:RIP metalloprotease RseP [Deltaproteobacteria bacterium]TLN05014.1 MAG: RIP metalloprotease RseP [bacterium]